MRIYLASKRRLVISVAVLAVSAAIFFPATAKADGAGHDEPAKAPHGHAGRAHQASAAAAGFARTLSRSD